jgi:hypothetical protein
LPYRKSERLTVAMKRVMNVERKSLSVNGVSITEEKPIGNYYGRTGRNSNSRETFSAESETRPESQTRTKV